MFRRCFIGINYNILLYSILLCVVCFGSNSAKSAALCWHKTTEVPVCTGNSGSSNAGSSYVDNNCTDSCNTLWGTTQPVDYITQIQIVAPTALKTFLPVVISTQGDISVTGTSSNFIDDVFQFQTSSIAATVDPSKEIIDNDYEFINADFTAAINAAISSNVSGASDISDLIANIPAPSDKIFLYIVQQFSKSSDIPGFTDFINKLDFDLSSSNISQNLQCFNSCTSSTTSQINAPVVPAYQGLRNSTDIDLCYKNCSIAQYCDPKCDKEECFNDDSSGLSGYCEDMVVQRKDSPATSDFDCDASCTKFADSSSYDEFYGNNCSSYWKPRVQVSARTGAGGCTFINLKDTDSKTFVVDWQTGDAISDGMRAAPWGDTVPRTYYAALYKGNICVFDMGLKFFNMSSPKTAIRGITRQGRKGIVRAADANNADLDNTIVPNNGKRGSDESSSNYDGSVCYKVPLAEGPKPCCLKLKTELPIPNAYSLSSDKKPSIPSTSIVPSDDSTFLHPMVHLEFNRGAYGGSPPSNYQADFEWEYFDISTGALISGGRAKGDQCKTLKDALNNNRDFCIEMSPDTVQTNICIIEKRLIGGINSDVLIGCVPRSWDMPFEEIEFGVTAGPTDPSNTFDVNGKGSLDITNPSVVSTFRDPKIRLYFKLKEGSNIFTHSILYNYFESHTFLGGKFSSKTMRTKDTLPGNIGYEYDALCINGVKDSSGDDAVPNVKNLDYFIDEPIGSANGADLCVRIPPKPCGYNLSTNTYRGVHYGEQIDLLGQGSVTTHLEWPAIEIPDGDFSATGYAKINPLYRPNHYNGSGSYHPDSNRTEYKTDPGGYYLYCPPGYTSPSSATNKSSWNKLVNGNLQSEYLKIQCVLDPNTGTTSYALYLGMSVPDITCIRRQKCGVARTYCDSGTCTGGGISTGYSPYGISGLDSKHMKSTDRGKYTKWGELDSSTSYGGINKSSASFDKCLDTDYKVGSTTPSLGCDEFGIWVKSQSVENKCVPRSCTVSAGSLLSSRAAANRQATTVIDTSLSNPHNGICKSGYSKIHKATNNDYRSGNYSNNGNKIDAPKFLCLGESSSDKDGSWVTGSYSGQGINYNFQHNVRRCQQGCSAYTDSDGISWPAADPGQIVSGTCDNNVGAGITRQCGGINPFHTAPNNNHENAGIQVSRTIVKNSLKLIGEGKWSPPSGTASCPCMKLPDKNNVIKMTRNQYRYGEIAYTRCLRPAASDGALHSYTQYPWHKSRSPNDPWSRKNNNKLICSDNSQWKSGDGRVITSLDDIDCRMGKAGGVQAVFAGAQIKWVGYWGRRNGSWMWHGSPNGSQAEYATASGLHLDGCAANNTCKLSNGTKRGSSWTGSRDNQEIFHTADSHAWYGTGSNYIGIMWCWSNNHYFDDDGIGGDASKMWRATPDHANCSTYDAKNRGHLGSKFQDKEVTVFSVYKSSNGKFWTPCKAYQSCPGRP
jgi:hypothetical protein